MKSLLKKMFWLTGIVVVFIVFSNNSEDDKMDEYNSSSIVRNSPLDSSVRQVKRYLQKNLLDPDSYDPMEWSRVIEMNDGSFYVRHKFRAKNSFGGYVIENKIFYLDQKGKITGSKDYLPQ